MELRSDLSSRVRSSAELVAVEAESVRWRLPGPLLLARLLWNWLRVAVLYEPENVRRGKLSMERGLSDPFVGVALFCSRRVSNRALAGSWDLWI